MGKPNLLSRYISATHYRDPSESKRLVGDVYLLDVKGYLSVAEIKDLFGGTQLEQHCMEAIESGLKTGEDGPGMLRCTAKGSAATSNLRYKFVYYSTFSIAEAMQEFTGELYHAVRYAIDSQRPAGIVAHRYKGPKLYLKVLWSTGGCSWMYYVELKKLMNNKTEKGMLYDIAVRYLEDHIPHLLTY